MIPDKVVSKGQDLTGLEQFQVILGYKVAIPGTEEEETESATVVDMTNCSWASAEAEAHGFYVCCVIS